MFNTIKEAIEEFRAKRPIIVADDENRENEGDLIIPAQYASPEIINFMALNCRGLICQAITGEIADRLGITPMVEHNTDIKGTNFTQSVDADPKFGTTTGISAFDRAKTVSVIIDRNTKPADLRRPGHIFPLIAKEGGVLKRAGHTETAVDLAKLAGLIPSGVICEIMNENGTMARRDELFEFAKKHNIKMITVADLIEYRLGFERHVKRMVQTPLPTEFGQFEIYGYIDELTGVEHVALVKDDGTDKIPLVRMHSECLTGDIFHSLKCDCNQQLIDSLKMISNYGKGALVYIRDHEGRGIGLINKLKTYKLQDMGQDTVDANITLGFKSDLRNYGTGAQILLDIGYREFNLITNNPKKIVALTGYGLVMKERVAIPPKINKYNEKYIQTKIERMEHLYKDVNNEALCAVFEKSL
ncbi:MAG: 3,4-dihydroxy-2-butanone-4-phosphate synthase [Candidatus Gastranaerophilales bacterium]|nr:3,4-dihydroxy-2-butanone-4-phosphate synthase [Candidatus Gastranaerophilales bacterium]